MSEKKWINLALIAAVVAIFVVSFVLAPKPHGDEEGFIGTDSVVTGMLADQGTEPWFEPIFEPGSGEIESGLFALQAALGAGVLGYVLGNLRGRSRTRPDAVAAPEQGPDGGAGPDTAEAAPRVVADRWP